MKVNSILVKLYQNKFVYTPTTTNILHPNNTSRLADDDKFIDTEFVWLKNETLKSALKELYNIKFDVRDTDYINSLGLKLPFASGKDVVNYIASQNIRINFDKIAGIDTHAHYDFEKNSININSLYKNNTNKPVILAIASAILHETAHAKDNDGQATIQEELECLGMNAIAHRAFVKKYSDIFKNSDAPIIHDGVQLYADLFFNQKDLNNLINRVAYKYGNLPAGDKKHPTSTLAFAIQQFSSQNNKNLY